MSDESTKANSKPLAVARMSRRHHFLPQFYLAGFTSSAEKDGDLWILNRDDGHRWKGNPNSVAHQRDFYRVDSVPGVTPDAFEKAFATFEGWAATTLKGILEKQELPVRGTEGFDILINLVALMEARVPGTRVALTKPLEMISKMILENMVITPEHFRATIKELRESGVKISEDVDYEVMKEFVQGKHYSIEIPQGLHMQQLFEMIDILLPLLGERKWSLLIAEDGAGDFVTSDRPVSLSWTITPLLPGIFETPGFGLANTDVTFPLSKKLALLGRFEGISGRYRADQKRVATINSRTGMYCERFICSAQEDFPWLKSNGTVKGAADLVDEIKKELKAKPSFL